MLALTPKLGIAAIKEETSPEIESRGATVHWLSLGELSKLIETFRREGVTRAVMAGQVKHKQIFSSIRPDWRLAELLHLDLRNTERASRRMLIRFIEASERSD